MPPTYRVELAKTARAACQNTSCKKSDVKIGKGELRFGSLVEFGDHTSWKWKHWGCVTPRQFEQWQEVCEGDPDLMDGYDELPQDFQEKVMRCVKQGHVDDEEWSGDPGKNRPGEKGYKMTPKKEVKNSIETEDAEAGEDEEDGETPVKAKSKRGRKKKPVDSEAEAAKAAAPKKARGRPKKEVDGGDDAEEPPAKKKKRTAQKDDDGEDVEKRGRPKKKVIADGGSAADEKPLKSKGRGRKKKALATSED